MLTYNIAVEPRRVEHCLLAEGSLHLPSKIFYLSLYALQIGITEVLFALSIFLKYIVSSIHSGINLLSAKRAVSLGLCILPIII